MQNIINRLKKIFKAQVILFVLLLFTATISAQPFRITTYNLDKGLPTDLTKCIVQDALGFIWIGTDDGLVRFDGKNSLIFNRQLPSNYVKGLYKTSKNKVYAITDLGITEIISSADSTILKTIIYGIATITSNSDTTLNYPKSVFEDSHGNLWIGDYNNVMLYKNGKKSKYKFAAGEASSSYMRSFSFAEDGYGKLWVTSFPGHLFYFDEKNNAFVQVNTPSAMQSVSDFITLDKGVLLAGSTNGVFEIKTSTTSGDVSINLLTNTPQVSCLTKINQNKVFIGTWNAGLYIMNRSDSKSTIENIGLFAKISINQFYYSSNNSDLWVCTNDGVSLLQPTFFAALNIENADAVSGPVDYIQSISQAPTGETYVSSGPGVLLVKNDEKKLSSRYLTTWRQNGFVARIQATETGLYIGDSNGNIYFYDSKTSKYQQLTKEPIGRFCMFLTADRDKNIWACQEEFSGLVKVTAQGDIVKYQKEQGINSQINIVRLAPNGRLYAGGNNESSYLFIYDVSADLFKNISIPLGIKDAENFKVNDIVIDKQDNVWLGTSHGLFKYHDKKIEKIDLGDIYSGEAIKALATSNNGLWIANTYGILFYTSNSIFFYDKSSGLPANTVTIRNLFIDSENRLWAGTAKGASYSLKTGSTAKKSTQPIILNIKIDQQKTTYSVDKSLTVTNHSYIEIEYVSLSFPSEKIKYQYRVADISQNWSKTFTDKKLVLPPLSFGKHTVEIRAVQDGGDYQWSDPVQIGFKVERPWYATWWSVILYILAFGVILYFSVKYYTWKLEQDKIHLEKVIKQRTAEIEQQKEEISAQADVMRDANREILKQKQNLEELINEKNGLVSVVAHDLRSPLNNVFSLVELMEIRGELNDTQKELKYNIHQVLDGGRRLIQDIMDLHAMERHQSKINRTGVEIDKYITNLLATYRNAAASKGIKIFYNERNDKTLLMTDQDYLRRILDNLLTNAIKFSPTGLNIFVELNISPKEIAISVADEGPGFTDDDKQKVFKQFQKLSASPTGNESSTGLGLSIVKTLVERLSGTIELISSPGKGAKFIMRFKQS